MSSVPPSPDAYSSLSPAAQALLAQRAADPRAAALAPGGIPRRADPADAPLSSRQQQVWFFEQLEPGSAVYHLPKEIRLRGPLDTAALERAVNEVVTRHAILRTRFQADGEGALRQRVVPARPFRLRVVDAAGDVEGDGWKDQALRDSLRPFDLEGGEVIRAQLYRLAADDHLLHVVCHHIAFDGWSTGVLLRDLADAYRNALRGAPSPPPPVVQYGDFAAWESERLESGAWAGELSYWCDQLRGAPGEASIPTPCARPLKRSYSAARERLLLAPDLVQDLGRMAQSAGATPAMALLAAFELLLSRLSGARELVIGVPITGRTHTELEDLVGYFVNMLALRTDLSGARSFGDLLTVVRETSRQAYAHQAVPFDRVVAALRPARTAGSTPVFQVTFNYRNLPDTTPTFEGLLVAARAGFHGRALFDLSLDVTPGATGLECVLTYATELFDAPFARRLLAQLETVLGAIIADPDASIATVPLLRPQEVARIVEDGRGPAAPIADTCIHSLFEAQARRDPGAIAVIGDDRQLTYGELNQRADGLAARLRDVGVTPGDVVGVFVDRSPEQILTLLAILKTGCGYVPLDPAFPVERLAFIAADSGMVAVVTTTALAQRLPFDDVPVISLDDSAADRTHAGAGAAPATASADGLAYIIYTSGSTGTPKGVEVTHRSVVNLIQAELVEFELRPADRVLQFGSINFDGSVSEIFEPLAAGAAVVVCTPAMMASVPRFLQACTQCGVTILSVNTAFWHELVVALDEDELSLPSTVRLVMMGGEGARADRLARWRRRVQGLPLFNRYGPTETTVTSVFQDLTWPVAGEESVVPIGYPLRNTDLYVLDEHLQPTPPGIPGELCIGGAGLARGYRNRPELTAERFISNPLGEDRAARLYRTGDLVRLRDDGALDYLGRRDDQVKIRGFRIEPGEIEVAIGQHPSVRQTAVVPERDGAGDLRLVAYVVPNPGGFDPDAMRVHLRRFLPEHMLPAAFVQVAALPLMPNGKIDRPKLRARAPAASLDGAPPRGPVESALARIWEGVLGIQPIGRDADFFELGGHSLAAMRVVGRAEAALAMEVPLRALFEQPTIARLAEYLEEQSEESASLPPVTAAEAEQAPLSFAQRRLWFLDRLVPGRPTYNLPVAFRLRGRLDVAALDRALHGIVRRHEPLRTRITPGDGEVLQTLTDGSTFELQQESLMGVADGASELRRRLDAEAHRPFDLVSELPVRARLYQLHEREHVLSLCIHHIASDGWSEEILLRELEALYAGGSDLPDIPAGYRAYANWQRRHESLLQRGLERWVLRMRGARALDLPTDLPRPAIPAQLGGSSRRRLSGAQVDALLALARRERCTLHMALLAAFHLLLARLTGQDDVVISIPVAGRVRPELEPLIGLFANNLPIRADVENASFVGALQRARSATLTAYRDQAVPLDAIVNACGVQRTGSVNPLVQVAFALEPEGLTAPRLAGLEVERVPVRTDTSKFDLFLAATPVSGAVDLRLEFDAELFLPETADGFLALYQRLLEAGMHDPERPVAELDLRTTEERARLAALNDTARPIPDRTVHALFHEVAAAAPHAVAVQEGSARLTYAALRTRSSALAASLRLAGVAPGERVGLCMERGIELVVSMLGVLEAGGCYVPLDSALPRRRLEMILGAAEVEKILIAGELPASLRDIRTQVVDVRTISAAAAQDPAAPVHAGSPADLAYVIFTSGSTGEPKGVAVPHRAVVRLVRNADYVQIQPDDVVAQASTHSFDAATFEIWGALLNGARLEIVPRAQLLSPRELRVAIQDRRITTLFLTTALFNQMAHEAPDAFGTLRHLLFGGETSDAGAARLVLASGAPPARLLHVYGPTENTTFSTWHEVVSVPAEATTLPIGRPIANSTAWVLDAGGRPQPLGLWGELYVGGAGVARRYLGAPTRDDERFMADPFTDAAGARLYRTGDRARWTVDGVLEFGGRLDGQVKLRGFRVELVEIESALRRCAGVREAAVAVEGEGAARGLVAWIAGAPDVDVARVRGELLELLPTYMVPGVILVVPELPLNANGKLDWRALPSPAAATRTAAGRPPGDPLERQIAVIWQELLRIDRVGAGESFFELGGHSLLALEMIRRVEMAMGRTLGVQALFEEPTVAHLARTLARTEMYAGSPIVEVRKGDPGVVPFFFFHGDFNGAGLYTRNLVAAFDPSQPVYVVHPHQPGGPRTIEAMVDSLLPALRCVRPHGPYILGGHCNGGVVAFEMARRLCAGGERVELLVLVDVPARNITLVRFAGVMRRVGRALGIPTPLRRAAFRATRGTLERLATAWTGAGERTLTAHAKVLALSAWSIDAARRAAARLRKATISRPQQAAVDTPSEVELLRLERARYYWEAMSDYIPGRFHGRLLLIVPRDAEGTSPEARPELWTRMADASEIRSVDGNHLSVLVEDSASLSGLLARALKAAGQGGTAELRSSP